MKSEWLRNLPLEQQKEISELLRNSLMRQTFLGILDRMAAEEERQELTLTAYDSPSWAYKQADLNGARRVLTKLRGLFDFERSKTNG